MAPKKELENKDFKMLAYFQVKEDDAGEESVKIRGMANFQGEVDEQGYGTYIDRAGEVVQIEGVDVKDYKANPVVLWQHDRDKPIGTCTKIEKRKQGLWVEATVYKSVCGEEIFNAIKLGVIKAFSIGFRAIRTDWREVNKTMIRYIMKSSIYECSAVSVPCNAASLFQVVKSLPDGEGFYSGDLTDTKNFSEADENEHQYQGDVMKIKLADMLSAEDIAKFKSMGLEDKLAEETEVDVKSYIDQLVATKAAEIKAEIMTEIAAEKEAAAKEQEAEETKTDEGETPAEADDEGTKESTKEETKEDDELDEETIKALAAAVETLKTIV